ncbi:probable galactinol--sucrose galactosyltransferase 6 [Daucus carota subsp. sativus]|uniref:probable galactinol--sucrose galactosyltransferase 6 n=1 Tax=Daucus carota subsp. sativus TaxID=79200 RepID=UPI003083692B
MGLWGGVRPGVEGVVKYGSVLKSPVISKGVMENEPEWKVDPWYLASAGVDGVKVDVQSIWRVLALVYQVVLRSLSNTIRHLMLLAKNFSDNGCIDRMSQNTDSL